MISDSKKRRGQSTRAKEPDQNRESALPALPQSTTWETTYSTTPSSSSELSIQLSGHGGHFQAQAPIPEHPSSWAPAQWTHPQWSSQQWIPEPTRPYQAHSPLSPNDFDQMSDYPMEHTPSFSGPSQNHAHARHEGHYMEDIAHLHHPSVDVTGQILTSVPFINAPDESGEWGRLQLNSTFSEASHGGYQASSHASSPQYPDWTEPKAPYLGAMIERKPDSQENSATLHAHNQVEKRYRINLNRKIAMLRDSVPSIRRHGSHSEDDEGSNPSASRSDAETDRSLSMKSPMNLPPPVNKATVMEEATKYIKTLENSVRVLQKEQVQMRNELNHYRKLAVSSSEDESPGTRRSPNKGSK